MILSLRCAFCRRCREIEVTEEQARLLSLPRHQRPHIQDILPDHSADDREMFISQMCPKCWKATFGDEDDCEEVRE